MLGSRRERMKVCLLLLTTAKIRFVTESLTLTLETGLNSDPNTAKEPYYQVYKIC